MKQHPPNPPFIVAIESSSPVGSVAVFGGGQLLGYMEIRQQKSHARLLTPMIKTLMDDLEIPLSKLDGVAVSRGPGSYTGLRVGVSTAKGLCMALDKPLLSISSLESLAWQVQTIAEQLNAWICPMLDARRMEVYCAIYDADIQIQSPIAATIIEAGAFGSLLNERKVIFVGDGVAKCAPILMESKNAIVLADVLSGAKGMGKAIHQKFLVEDFEDLVQFEPYYLKDFVATKPKNPFA